MPKYYILLLLCSLVWTTLHAQKDSKDIDVNDYITYYKNIAIQEMERSGIPASITLAQGIHESAYGNSELARKAKNHFGIKCTKDWQGKTMYKWDDEARKSCFRFYSSAEDSYVDHTDFLLNRRHYAFLFNYDRTDYKRWAKGLKKAGYATDPRYPEKLIKTIERYKLQQYDKVTGVLAYDTTRIVIPSDIAVGERRKPRSFFFKRYKPGLFRTNDATYAISRKGESALALAKRFGIPYKRFLKFNDLEDGDQLMDYQPAYIQPKKSTYRGEEEVYKVEKDITMYEISQEFGIKMSNLLAFNLMKEGEEPQNGEMVQLKETSLTRPKLRPRQHVDMLPSPYVEEDKNAPLKTPVKGAAPIAIPKVERPKPQALVINTPTYDPVVYADTTRINTSKSKDKAFLDAQITPSRRTATTTTKTSTTVVRRRPSTTTTNPSNSTVVRRPANNNPATNNPNSNTTVIRRPVNKDVLFNANGQANNNQPVVIEQPKKTDPSNNPTGLPKDYKGPNNTTGFNNAGSTRDYKKTVKPVIENPNVVPVPKNTLVIQPLGEKGIYHTVKKGETLYAIHRRYNIPVVAIQEANQLNGTNLEIGQKIKIPVK
ncbi:MAG: glucosaminidase domain-containing protein [Aureispira sp.]